MDNWIWNLEGTKVQHVLSGWTGIVTHGKQIGLMGMGDEFPIATVRFVVWESGDLTDDDMRCHFEQIDCIEAELKEPKK